MNINELGSIAIVLVIAAVIIAVGATIENDLAENTLCDYTWVEGTGNTTNTTTQRTNPLTDSWIGCCFTPNTTYQQGVENGGYCILWVTNDTSLNVTSQGLEAMETLGEWLPIIAVVAAAVIVISLLVVYFGSLAGKA